MFLNTASTVDFGVPWGRQLIPAFDANPIVDLAFEVGRVEHDFLGQGREHVLQPFAIHNLNFLYCSA